MPSEQSVAKLIQARGFLPAKPPANIPLMTRGTDRVAPASLRLTERYQTVRAQTEALAAPLSAEDQTVQSMPDVSPTKWHLAHTTWFFETFLLRKYAPNYRVYSEAYEVLFNSYYNSVGEQFARPKRGLLSRPGKEEVLAYRHHVDEAMLEHFPQLEEEAAQLVELGLQHEQQHQELLLTDIKHVLSQNPLHPVYVERALAAAPKPQPLTSNETTYIGFEGGIVEVGHTGAGFHYDNEEPRHRVLLSEFELAARPLSNQDVLTFIEAGGYSDPLLWLSDGWTFLRENGATHPLYWKKHENEWMVFTLHGLEPLRPEETAAHLTYFEADAIARFLGARLPTEFEWEHAAASTNPEEPTFDPAFLSPGRPAPRSFGSLSQLLGGVWEWTQSAYAAYPGYSSPAGAIGEYNGKFMHNQFVLRGGSCVTPTDHVRITYRNFFPSSARWQFSGARLAKGKTTT